MDPPWKTLYEWYTTSRWCDLTCSEDLYDSDDYEEAPDQLCVPLNSLAVRQEDSFSLAGTDSWIDLLEIDEAETLAKVEAAIELSGSTALKGIPPQMV